MKDFIGFLIEISDLAHGLYAINGKMAYDKYRNEFIEIQIILEFIQTSFGLSSRQPKSAPYTLYLQYREEHLE